MQIVSDEMIKVPIPAHDRNLIISSGVDMYFQRYQQCDEKHD